MVLTAGVCLALVTPWAAFAQTAEATAALARIEQLGEDAPFVSSCEDHGYQSSEAKVEAAMTRAAGAAMAAGLDDAAMEKAMDVGGQRGMKMLEAELSKLTAGSDLDALRAAVRVWAEGTGTRCARMATGPAGTTLVTAPPGFDRAKGLAAAMDEFLEPAGIASWQTPRIAAIGQFAYEVGTCRSRLGARKAEAMVAPFTGKLKSTDKSATRDQRYYAESYEAGVEDIKDAAMTREDCAALAAPGDPA